MKTFIQYVVFRLADCSPVSSSWSLRARDGTVTGRSTSASYSVLGKSYRGGFLGALRPDVAGIPAKGKATSPGQSDAREILHSEGNVIRFTATKSDILKSISHFPRIQPKSTVQPDGFVVLRGAGLVWPKD